MYYNKNLLYIAAMKYGIRVDIQKLIQDREGIKEKYATLSKSIKEENYKVSELGLKPRWVVHWEEKGLFINETPKGKWHSFNLIEAFWIKILLKFRSYNLPLDSIREIKDQLVYNLGETSDEVKEIIQETIVALSNKEEKSDVKAILLSENFQESLSKMKINLLEMFVLDMIILRNEFRLLVKENGELLIQKENYHDLYSDNQQVDQFLAGSYLSVSFNEILGELIGDIGETEISKMQILTPEEAAVIEAIREEEVVEVNVKLKKGIVSSLFQIDTVKEKKLEAASRLTELISSGGYQDITIKIEGGNIVYCKNVGKKRLN